jgi:hypothetical protein
MEKQDLTGKRFGLLTVIGKQKHPKHRGTWWLCLCDCGNTRLVIAGRLKGGITRSCKECFTNIEDITGKRFGRLVVISLYSKCPRVTWLCRCDCGNYTTAYAINLKRNYVSSCGCYRKEVTRNRSIIHGLSHTKEYKREIRNRRRERKKKLDYMWTREMEQILRELYPACVLCGITNEEHQEKYGQSLHIDHVTPLSKGGKLQPGNVVVLCLICNSKKHNLSLHDLDWTTASKLLRKSWEFEYYWRVSESNK